MASIDSLVLSWKPQNLIHSAQIFARLFMPLKASNLRLCKTPYFTERLFVLVVLRNLYHSLFSLIKNVRNNSGWLQIYDQGMPHWDIWCLARQDNEINEIRYR